MEQVENPMVADLPVQKTTCFCCMNKMEEGDTALRFDGELFCCDTCVIHYVMAEAEEVEL